MEDLMKSRSVGLSHKTFSLLMNGLLLILAVPGLTQAVMPTSIEPLTPEGNIPPAVYQWLSRQQDNGTGLLPSQQDNLASTYNNALAVMVFTLKGDYAKAKRILHFFHGRAGEFFKNSCNSFNSSCSQTDPCDENAPCGFFQYRDSTTGLPFQNINRWMGDNAWLLIAIHYYQAKTGDASYSPMARAVIRLLESFQQSNGHIASGWENDDSIFNIRGHAEGNLDAYKALLLHGKTLEAQKVKRWLDLNNLDWKKGPLDLHSWRVLSLGKGYGFSLPDAERTDDNTVRYKNTINYKTAKVRGFLPFTALTYFTHCRLKNNLWSEGTGQMAVSYYKAGYKGRGDFYVGELEKLLFEPVDFPGTRTLSYLAHSSPLPSPPPPKDCPDYSWVRPSKGQVAAVSWYIFAKTRFNPFEGVVINSFQVKNPIAKLEAENFDSYSSTSAVRLDATGIVSEGRGIHLGGDDALPNNNSGWVEFKFNILTSITITSVDIRYADDIAGDVGKFFLDGNLIANFNTANTGTWSNYIVASLPVGPIPLQPGLHTFRVQVKDNGTYGFTIDYFKILF
jgi:hypothetical protein